MRTNKNLKILAAALLVALAASTSFAAQTSKANQSGALDVIAIQARVEGRSELYGLKPNLVPIPVNAGERVRIHLVGTAIINGIGVEREIPARFSVVSGRSRVDILRSGEGWALVQVNGNGDGTAQLGYVVTGNSYEMKGGLREGRITFEIGGEGLGSSSGSVGSGSVDRTRWNRARDLTDQLYRSILGAAPQGDVAQRDLEHIYEMGATGVRDVALELADDVSSRYDGLPQNDAVDVLGDLYRGLLRRTSSDDQLWDQDPGFRTNVDNLRRQGYERMVQIIIDAPEFRAANDLNAFGSLAGYDNESSWRSGRSRYAIRQY